MFASVYGGLRDSSPILGVSTITMRQADEPKMPSSADDARRRTDEQRTILLSDVPEAAALMPEASPQSTEPAGSQLSSQALSVLSQRYEVLAEAGHGSMGNVYKARDRETGEIVALKLLKPEIASDQAMMERFKNELLFARKITHKNVCRVHEFNRIGGIAYTSMEFVEGESLRSVLNRFGGLPLRKALDLAQQICSGLQEAHAQGIVHRDLKPENVMLDAQGNVKIMDFGIARSMEAGTRLTGSMVGTPAYMAPEQVAGKPVDYRTDIYSLGLILYEVFTGTPAFQADNAVAVALKQMRESPTPPHEVEPTIPVPIERAILKCLEKEPSKRFQTVAELKNVLKAPAVAAPAVSAPPAAAPLQSNHIPPLASHPLYGSSALSVAQPKRRSHMGWVLLALLLASSALAATHWAQVKRMAEQVLPPATPAAPKPPDFALDQDASPIAAPDASKTKPEESGASPSDATQAGAAEPTAKQPSEEQAAPARAPVEKPAIVTAPSERTRAVAQDAPPPKPPRRAAANAALPPSAPPSTDVPEVAPEEVQKRADKAFGETEPVAAPPVNDHTPSYLWVGRFEREDRAQSTAKKIEDLGLPVAVIPRQNDTGEFYVVLTGPFGPERVPSVMDWLKTQGFPGVRVVKNPLAGGRQAQ